MMALLGLSSAGSHPTGTAAPTTVHYRLGRLASTGHAEDRRSARRRAATADSHTTADGNSVHTTCSSARCVTADMMPGSATAPASHSARAQLSPRIHTCGSHSHICQPSIPSTRTCTLATLRRHAVPDLPPQHVCSNCIRAPQQVSTPEWQWRGQPLVTPDEWSSLPTAAQSLASTSLGWR
ncbi:MAG: hypothetical protein WDW36_003797 [Sanguina aurantia]